MNPQGRRAFQAASSEGERDLDRDSGRKHEQRRHEALATERHQDDGRGRDQGPEVRDEPADEESGRELPGERRPDHQHDGEHRRSADRGGRCGRAHQAADPQCCVPTAVAERRPLDLGHALERPLHAVIGVEKDEEREEGAQDRDRRRQRDVSGQRSELVLDERFDDRSHLPDRRGHLRRDRESDGAGTDGIETALERVDEVGDRWDERDDDEPEPSDDDRTGGSPRGEGCTGPWPAPCAQGDEERGGRGGDDGGEHERGRFGDKEKRDPGKDDCQSHDDEDPPPEGLEVLKPGGHRPRRRSRQRCAVARRRRVVHRASRPSLARRHDRPGWLRSTSGMPCPREMANAATPSGFGTASTPKLDRRGSRRGPKPGWIEP